MTDLRTMTAKPMRQSTWWKQQQGQLGWRLQGLLSIAAVAVVLVWLWQQEIGAVATISALFLGLAFVFRTRTTTRHLITYVLGAMVIVAAFDYLGWRIRLINLQGFWIGIPLYLAELFGALHVIGFQITLWPQRVAPLKAEADPYVLPIFVFIPTVNEGAAVVRETLYGALNAREHYLHTHPEGSVTIVVCNDGFVARYPHWHQIEQLAQELGVTCITRSVGGGAKAGNLENARQTVGATDDALIVIFDADQIADRDFLTRTVPPFADSKVGWVQTGQYYDNVDNEVSAWAQDQQSLFYRLLCPGKSARNAAFICGTNVVLRARALDEIGGLPQDSVTEDFAASIDLHPRWRSIYIDEKLASGIGPMDLQSYFKQQNRWAIGTLGVMRSHWRQILLPQRNGLSMGQRVQYLLACTHYLSGLRDFIYIVAPITFILTGTPAVRGSDLESFLHHFLPYFLSSQLAFWVAAHRITGLRGIMISFASFPTLLGAITTVLTGRRVGFQVTSKQRLSGSNLLHVRTHLVFIALSAVALVYGLLVSLHTDPAAVIISMVWLLYQSLMLMGGVWLAVADDAQKRAPVQAFNAASGMLSSFVARQRAAVSAAVVGATMMAIGVTVVSPRIHPMAPAFEPTRSAEVARFGVKVPYALLEDRPDELASALHTPLSIVGRTQEITDVFDTDWAAHLSETGAMPWITLLFSDSEAEPYFGSLPAIANGVHDERLVRWAREIAGYGNPVFMTILPHADRNWVISSAVANGGIPQDVAKAWLHVQAIFQQEGALNVAWVWAPANPIDDALYAPPAESIDVVLMSLIRYPDTEWPDPQDELTALVNAYPNTNLFIEVSAAGAPERKAAYFQQLGDVLDSVPNLYALLYYEGSPSPDAAIAEHDLWSILSDSMSSDAMRDLVGELVGDRRRADQGGTSSGV